MPQQLEEPCDMTASGQLHFSAEAEAQWRELFEYSPVMYFMVDPAGTVLAVNTFGAAQLGYSVSELVGQSVLKVFFPDDKAAAGKNLQLCVQTAGQQNKWEIRKVRKDGTLLWVRENAKAVRRSDGNLIVLIACEDISDQKRGEQRLAAQSGVSRVLAESDSLAEASPHLLRTICEAMDWDWGALWSVRQQQPERLRCDCIWHASSIDVSEFDAASQKSACAPGEGRAGQVWKTRQSLWIADVAKDPGFRRGPAAARSGLHTGLACPILLGGEALGIVEFFSRRIREPDEQELATLSAIGSQIGQFIRRKRAEQAVQASEKRFRALIEHAYDIVLLLSAEGTILYASPSVERVLGYAPEEVIGRDGYELVHPDHRQSSVTRFTRSVQELGSVITGERLLLHKDGSSRWVENVIVNLLAEPSVQAVVMRQRDVTERKQAEAALRESEQRFRTLVQFSFDVYWESDAQHRFTRQEFAEGLADAPVPGSDIGIGKTRWELPHLEPGEEAWRKHRETLDAHLPFRDFELARPGPDGSKRYVSVSGLPVFDETGRFVGYRGVGRHITERKRAEEALRSAHAELAHANRVATMGQLTASVAHEVSQPIAATVLNAQAALRWLGAQPPNLNEVRQILGQITDDSKRAGDVIGRIRALIKKAPPQKEALEINEAILEVIALTRGEVVQNGIAVRTQLADGLPRIQADRVQLQQVILNLIVNAVQAMSGASDGTRELLIATSADASNGVLVSLRDSGPGLDPASLERLFDAFYTTKSSGLGMGLSICRSIIEAHGGRIWASANEPRGAVFHLSLPLERDESIPARTSGPIRPH